MSKRCYIHHPQHLWKRVSAGDQGKMRSSGWTLLQSDWCPHGKGSLGHRDTQSEDAVKTQETAVFRGATRASRGRERPGRRLQVCLHLDLGVRILDCVITCFCAFGCFCNSNPRTLPHPGPEGAQGSWPSLWATPTTQPNPIVPPAPRSLLGHSSRGPRQRPCPSALPAWRPQLRTGSLGSSGAPSTPIPGEPPLLTHPTPSRCLVF